MKHALTLKDISDVTHDTRRLVFDRPADFTFEAGQATELAVDRDGWRDEGRPFTMTSQPEDDTLEFIIKIYPDHDGVTEQIATLEPGETVHMDEPFGALTDHGAGIFIAGGAGITPFICLLRRRARQGKADACRLIYSNKTERDIILHEEWNDIAGLATDFVTDAEGDGHPDAPVDRDFLEGRIDPDASTPVYLCGPPPMVDAVRDTLKAMGVADDRIRTEEGW